MAGHHVAWLPTAESEIKVIRRIVKMLEDTPAIQVAAQLTAEGIPSPDQGRWRKDGGIKHPVSGVWHETTVVSIARNSLLAGVTTYGVRSMGDKLRFTNPQDRGHSKRPTFGQTTSLRSSATRRARGLRRQRNSSHWWTSVGISSCRQPWMPAAARSAESAALA